MSRQRFPLIGVGFSSLYINGIGLYQGVVCLAIQCGAVEISHSLQTRSILTRMARLRKSCCVVDSEGSLTVFSAMLTMKSWAEAS